MDGAMLSGLAARILGQDVDLAFGFDAQAAPGDFVVLGFDGAETLFDGFEISVDLVSDRDAISLQALLDTAATLTIYDKYDVPRHLNGVIAEIEKRGTGLHRTFYRVTLKPALHRLHYVSDSRIFQALSVPDIAKMLLEEHGVTQVDWRLEADHAPREYCVQYGETSYDFLRRILAEEGIFFWFAHSADDHTMILSDAPLGMPVLPAAPLVTYNNLPGGTVKGSFVRRFDQIERLRATHRVSKDYSFKQPGYHQKHSAVQASANGAKGKYELYHYPGRHKDPGAGQPFNDHQLEAHRVDATTGEGETNNVQLSAGFVFALAGHPDAAINTDHRLLSVTHHGTQPAALQEEAPVDGATRYQAQFTTQPARIAYRPVNPNPKPMVEGPQIAQVTGPEGEEIYCDDHGRIKIWFPWDRHGAPDEHASCWVRVAQNWAGGSYGHIAIPRIGHEVVVDFLSGDPDQPIVTGRTYHATNKPPYPLPENKTRMSIKSQTHKGDGFNELRFEDEAGQEEVFVHAQRNKNEITQNDLTETIGHDHVKFVRGDVSEISAESVRDITARDKNSVTGGDYHISTGDKRTRRYNYETFKDDDGGAIKAKHLKGIKGTGKGDFSVMSSQSISLQAKLTTSINSIEGVFVNSKNSLSMFAGKSLSLSSDGEMMENVGTFKNITVGDEFRITCGKSSITLKKNGEISIKGKLIYIDGADALSLNSTKIKLN